MKKWFKTLKEATKYYYVIKGNGPEIRVFKSKTRKAKAYFVGTYLDWLQY